MWGKNQHGCLGLGTPKGGLCIFFMIDVGVSLRSVAIVFWLLVFMCTCVRMMRLE